MKKLLSTIFLITLAVMGYCFSLPLYGNDNPLGKLKWKFKTNGRIYSSPVISGSVLYIGSEDKNLYAINVSDGTVKWTFATGGAVHSTPCVYNDVVYAGSFDGYYYAVDTKTGKLKWKFKTGGEHQFGGIGYWGMKPENEFLADPWEYFLSSPVIDTRDGISTLYFGSSDGNLYAVDARSGKLQWKFKTENVIHTTPVIKNNLLYVSSWDALHAIDLTTHEEKWNFHTGGNIYMRGIQTTVAADHDNVYLGTRDGAFVALQGTTGNKVWVDSMSGSWVISSAKLKNGHIYVGTSDSYLMLSLNATTGAEEFRFKANGYIFSSPFITDKKIYFGDYTGKIFGIDIASGGRQFQSYETEGRQTNSKQILNNDYLDFQFLFKGKDQSLYASTMDVMREFDKLGPIVSSPLVDNNNLYFGSADGYLYALSLPGD